MRTCSAHFAKVVSATRLVIGGLLLTAIIRSDLAAQDQPPNVIIIFTDDQGTIDANCFGADDLVTPAIDRLATEGTRFTQFYAAAPVCSPSRSGLLTGRYPVRAGVPGNVSSSQGREGMPVEQVTIAETLREAGYVTGHVGKWHLGYTPETMPRGQGFDYSFGHMGGCIDNYSHFFYWQGPNRHDLWENETEVFRNGEFFPDLMVEKAVDFIEENQQQPFFLYFAMNTPHYPYQGDPEWLEHYRDADETRKLYAAFVSTLDARIGDLLAALDRLQLESNTIVVFQSDHGHSHEERAHFGGGSAGPYRGAKFSLFEGGIRVPAIIRWPGKIESGGVRDQVAHGCDWLPTLAELCGVELIETDVDGKSLMNVIVADDSESPHTVLHWTHGRSWCVRDGDWKLLGDPNDTSNKGPLGEDDKLFLSNVVIDPSEMINLASEHPERVERLMRLHQEWVDGL